MTQVQHRGLAGQGGEGAEIGAGAVDDDSVGRHGGDVDAGGEVVEVAGAGGGGTVGGHLEFVVLHHCEEGRVLVTRGVHDPAHGRGHGLLET